MRNSCLFRDGRLGEDGHAHERCGLHIRVEVGQVCKVESRGVASSFQRATCVELTGCFDRLGGFDVAVHLPDWSFCEGGRRESGRSCHVEAACLLAARSNVSESTRGVSCGLHGGYGEW
jgi:hypothetical protein